MEINTGNDPTEAKTEAKRLKFLILRFSSFGDVTQCLSVPSKMAEKFPNSEIHWAIREDLSPLLQNHPHIQKIWTLPRQSGLKEILGLARQLRKQNYTHVYDAHNSTRSWVLSLYLKVRAPCFQFIRKSQKRWHRFLLFKFRINKYRMPRSGQRDLLEPLGKWGITESLPPPPQLFLLPDELRSVESFVPAQPYISLAPSAAYELKRWPSEHWMELIRRMPGLHFVLLGGPEDRFLDDIQKAAPERVVNLAGKTNLRQTSAVVKKSLFLVTNDTGILHTAEQQGHPAIALMGPAPFGFPSRPSTVILERDLHCRPCSKHGQGPCVNPNFQACLRDIKPREVVDILNARLNRKTS